MYRRMRCIGECGDEKHAAMLLDKDYMEVENNVL